VTPDQIQAIGAVAVDLLKQFGAIVATVASAVAGYYTWKNRYELDKLYACTYRANEDGSPGPMRRHPGAMVKLFTRTNGKVTTEEVPSAAANPPDSQAGGGDRS
jgi:hypothetical protein